MLRLLKRNRRTTSEYIFDNINILLMIFICFITLYPIWYVIVNSLNEGMDAMKGGIYWWPREFTLDNYKAVLSNEGILTSFGVTIAKTIIGTITHVFFTAMVAYALSRKDLRRSEEHTSELQSRENLVCRLVLEKKNQLAM